MMHLNASILSKKLSGLFSKKELKGKIHSRFQNAFNIELDEGFLFNFLPEKLPPNPRSLLLPMIEWDKIHGLSPPVGLPVKIMGNQLEIPLIALEISFGESELWDPSPSLPGPPIPDAEIHQNLEIVSMVVQQDYKRADTEKNAHKTFYEAFQNRICRAANNLSISISNCNFEDISKNASQLVGLGSGLTPSGDDILSGVMTAGVFCSMAYKVLYFDVQKINNRICSGAFGRTTIFSQILLGDSSMGEVVRPVGQLLQGLLCSKDKSSLIPLTREVMNLGGASGKDMLEGILLGIDAFLRLRDNLLRRHSWEGFPSTCNPFSYIKSPLYKV